MAQHFHNDVTDQILAAFYQMLNKEILMTDHWWRLLDNDNALAIFDSSTADCPIRFMIAPWLSLLNGMNVSLGRTISYALASSVLFSPFLWMIGDYSGKFNACIVHGLIQLVVISSVAVHDYVQTMSRLEPLVLQYLWFCTNYQWNAMKQREERQNLFLNMGKIHVGYLRDFVANSLEDIWEAI